MKNVDKKKISEIGEVIESVIDAVKNRTLAREEYKAFHSLCREYGIGKRSFDLTKSLNRAIYSDELAERKNIVLCRIETPRSEQSTISRR